jgi:murein L,D-transpeptidase YafK
MKHFFALLLLPIALTASIALGAPKVQSDKPVAKKILSTRVLKKKSKPKRVVVKASTSKDDFKTKTKSEPKVTLVRIDKSDHKLEVVAGSQVLKTYRVAIGSGGMGPKRFEGDKTTPVGHYRVTTRFRPLFHQFIGVSYPSDEDRVRYADLKRKGIVPPGRGVGFGIGIHGVGSRELAGIHKQEDWTHGCIAMDDDEIDEFGRLVPEGTAIEIVD